MNGHAETGEHASFIFYHIAISFLFSFVLNSVFPLNGMMPRHAVGFLNDLGGGAVSGEQTVKVAVTPDLKLSMLEFYLFSFAWVRQGRGGLRLIDGLIDCLTRLFFVVLSYLLGGYF